LTETDGRRVRGAQRRQQLIEASLRVLERDGLPGLTHRAVAAEAGVAPASATYHFEGIDDLAVSAILEATDGFVRSIGERSDGTSVSGYAAALAEELSRHRGRLVAGHELYLLASRRPALRQAARAWRLAGTEPLLSGLDEDRRYLFLAVVDSVCLEAVLGDEPPGADRIEQLLGYALR
jgi:TetR/AcrR family transcriptional regulator, regulator of biofilm formation and stress response